MTLVLILLTFSGFFLIFRTITVIIHEAGHAIAGLLLFKEGISVYIGSYGDPKQGLHIKIGRLSVHFKFNVFIWNGGLCKSETNDENWLKLYLFTLAGPLASLLTSILCFASLLTEFNGIIKLFGMLLFLSSSMDFFSNISANPNPIKLYDGTYTYNDGQSLKLLWKYRLSYLLSHKLVELYNSKNYELLLNEIKNIDIKNLRPDLIRLSASSQLICKNYQIAITQYQHLEISEALDEYDLSSYALCYSRLNRHYEALERYNQSLQINPDYEYSLNNRGFTYNILGRYDEAIQDFEKVLSVHPDFAYSLSNKGYSLLKKGDNKSAFTILEMAFNMDNTNAYTWRNLGIYYLETGDFKKAHTHFLKAAELNAETYGIFDYIKQVENKMSV